MEGTIADDVPCSSVAVDSIIRMSTAGVLWGWCAGTYDAKQLGLSGIASVPYVAKSVGRFGFQWGMFAAIFSSTRCGMQRYRGQNDWFNAFVGGAVAGAAIGAGTRSWKQVAGMTGLLGVLYHHINDDS